MDQSRRNFLFGTLTAASGALVVAAQSDLDVKLFKPTLRETVALTRIPHERASAVPLASGEMIFNSKGQALGVVRSFTYSWDTERHDVTQFGDNFRSWKSYPPRYMELAIQVVVAGHTLLRTKG